MVMAISLNHMIEIIHIFYPVNTIEEANFSLPDAFGNMP